MANSLHYSYGGAAQYPQAFYLPQQAPRPPVVLSDSTRVEQPQRKRPKYTRSKTGCLICRSKKVKCDEEKPDCARCRAGQRQCVWPDANAPRKRYTRRDSEPSQSSSLDARPSTAGSSGMSEVSTPPKRYTTPPKVEPVEYPLSQTLPHHATGNQYRDPGVSRPVSNNRQQQQQQQQQQFYPREMQGYAMQPGPPMPSMPELQSPYPQSSRHSPNWVLPTPQSPIFMQSRVPAQQGFYPVKSEDITDWEESLFQHQHVDPLQPFFPSAQQARGMEFMKYH